MHDLLYTVITIIAFAIMALYTRSCDKLQREE
jgi:hypothetical protein